MLLTISYSYTLECSYPCESEWNPICVEKTVEAEMLALSSEIGVVDDHGVSHQHGQVDHHQEYVQTP
jgi:hypothetical protein